MSLLPTDLATIVPRADGNLEIALDRFGRLIITSPHSGIVLDVHIARDPADKAFKLFLSTRVSEDGKLAKAAAKANKGNPIGATYHLAADGKLTLIDGPAKSAEDIDKTTGSEAATAPEPTTEAEPETTGAS